MKRINLILPLGILFFLFVAISCTKDEKSSVDFVMKASDTDAPVLSANQPPSFGLSPVNLPLEWNTAWIYITRLELNAEFYGISDIDDKDKFPDFHYEWQGNQKIDLLGEPRIFANMELPEGEFKSFELTMTSARFGVTDEPNFYLAGTYGHVLNTTPVAVEITEEFELTLNYDRDDAITTNKESIFKSVVEISLDHVFNGITTEDMANAEMTDGWILISKTHNVYLYNKILENLLGKPETSITWSLHKIQ